MKLGKIVSTMEDLNVAVEQDPAQTSPLEELENAQNPEPPSPTPDKVDPSGVKAVEYEFPDEFVPADLNLDLLKQTNESLMTNGDLAAQQIDALKDSIDIVREVNEVTPMTAAVIKTQLANIMSVFPETKLEEKQYLEQHMTSDSPLVVQATVESMLQGMDALRPMVTRTLQAAKNIAGFLQRSEDIAVFDQRLKLANSALTRTERHEDTEEKEEASTGFHQDRWRDLYPNIVKAVQSGYKSSEVPDVIGTNNEDDRIPETAIIAISRGVEKLPLNVNRAITGLDLGSLVEFLKTTTEMQTQAIEALKQVSGQLQGGDNAEQLSLNAMNLKTAADTIIAGIYKSRDDQGRTAFHTYKDGPSVIFSPDGQSMVPQTDGATNHGWVEPGDLSDMVSAITEKVAPVMKALKEQAIQMGQIATALEGQANQAFSNHVQMGQLQGAELTSAFNKLMVVLKFINDMVTVSVETTLNLVTGLCEISRGVAIIVES